MKQIKMNRALLSILTIFAIMSGLPSPSFANSPQTKVIIQINEHGFFDANGKAIHEYFEIPKDSNVKLVFKNIGKAGEEHEFVLLFDSDEEVSSGVLSDVQDASIDFHTGEEGELYDVFCVIVDCDGMEHLTDLVLIAV